VPAEVLAPFHSSTHRSNKHANDF